MLPFISRKRTKDEGETSATSKKPKKTPTKQKKKKKNTPKKKKGTPKKKTPAKKKLKRAESAPPPRVVRRLQDWLGSSAENGK